MAYDLGIGSGSITGKSVLLDSGGAIRDANGLVSPFAMNERGAAERASSWKCWREP